MACRQGSPFGSARNSRLSSYLVSSFAILSALAHFPMISGSSENISPNSASQLSELYPQTCYPIERDSFCADMPYNATTLSPRVYGQAKNLAGETEYLEAMASLNSFATLVKIGCSSSLKLFLCAVHLPMCTKPLPIDTVIVIPPCRTLCEAVRDKCSPVLEDFHLPWPPSLKCDQYPEANAPNSMCMAGGIDSTPKPKPVPKSKSTAAAKNSPDEGVPYRLPAKPIVTELLPSRCQENGMITINSTKLCAYACDTTALTTQEEKNTAEVFHGVVALFAVLLGFTVLSVYACRSVQLTAQEKPILMIIICMLMVSTGYIARLAGGRSAMGCTQDDGGPSYVIVNGVLEVKTCIAVFVLLYYFGLAAYVWWIAMAVLWCLSAVKEAKPKDMEKYLKYAHAAAWTVPALPTGVALWLKLVDADELSGICHVGQQNPDALLFFLLIPLCIVMIAGSAILVYGFVVCRRRQLATSSSDSRSTKTASSDCSTTRLSTIVPRSPSQKHILTDRFLFTKLTLFLASSVIVLALLIAEYVHKDIWKFGGVHGLPVLFYYIRILMQYAYGYTVAVWLMIVVVTTKMQRKIPQKTLQPPMSQVSVMSPYTNFREPTKMRIFDSDLTSNDYESIPVPAPTEASYQYSASASTAFPYDAHLYNSKVAAQQQQQNFIRQEHSKRSLQSVLYPGAKELPVTLV